MPAAVASSDPEEPPRRRPVSTRLLSSRWLVLLLTIPGVLLWQAGNHEPRRSFTANAGLAGDPGRWAAATKNVTPEMLSTALWWDYAFIASVVLIAAPLSRLGITTWGPEYRRRSAWRFLPALVRGAAVLDGIENVLFQAYLADDPGHVALVVLSTVSWIKFTGYALSTLGLLWCVVSAAVLPLVRSGVARLFGSSGTPAPVQPVLAAQFGPRTHPEGLGLCMSGGGIRAAAVAFGALQSFGGATGLLAKARWMASVSGGGYTAGGWQVTRGAANPPVADRHLAPGWTASVRTRIRYLENPVGGLAWGGVQVAARMLLALGAVAATGYLLGFGEGSLMRGSAMHPGFNLSIGLFPARLLSPGLSLVAVAALLIGLGLLLRWRGWSLGFAQAAIAAGKGLGALGVALLAVLIVAPAVVKYSPGLLYRIGHPAGGTGNGGSKTEGGTAILSILSALGVVTALTGLAMKVLQRLWLRLGGVLLAVGWVLLVEQVAQHVATRETSASWSSAWAIVGYAAIGLLLLADLVVPAHQATLNGIYRKRVAGTFALIPSDTVPWKPVPRKQERRWADYAELDGPKLITCATAHSTRLSRGGVKGHAFTFARDHISYYADDETLLVPTECYPTGTAMSGFPREWTVSRAMAISGAALASAMGRQALGTTNALLAATSLRLGAWIPNPRFISDFAKPSEAPRVHLGYLAKEIFGRYRPDRDPFVYVADGGHRDNLGLSELLRERPKIAVVVDASGDTPGKFHTLKECISLVMLEQHIDIDVVWQPIETPEHGLPADCVTTGTITYSDGKVGTLVYGRYQPCDRCPGAVRAFADSSKPFPYYSTADQGLADHEFEMLVLLGEHVGERLHSVTLQQAAYATI